MGKIQNISGRAFGRLTVIKFSHIDKPYNRAMWVCQCVCGNSVTVAGVVLRKNGSTSCGCRAKEVSRDLLYKHGLYNTPAYRSWGSMKSRCDRPETAGYENYGGRGITYHPRWVLFENFFEDMGARPIGTTLDRIDPEGNYEPRNCRWATPSEQLLNRRKWGPLAKFSPSEMLAEIPIRSLGYVS